MSVLEQQGSGITRLPAFAVLGVAIGVVACIAGMTGPSWAWFLAHYGAGYVLLIVVIAVRAPSAATAALRSVACFVPFVAGYYLVVQLRFGAIPVLYAAAWLAAAVAMCPGAAWTVRRSRARGVLLSAVVASLGASAVLADGTVANQFRGQGVDPVFAVIDLLIVGTILLLVPATRRGRAIGVLLTVPFGVVATALGYALHYGPGPYG